jgi:mannose-6-phosphate isomerase-like protein (cupin superfamily)
MKNNFILGCVFALFIPVVIAQKSLSPAFYINADVIMSALEKSVGQRKNVALGPIITSGDDYHINLLRRTAGGGAIVHEEATELHYITEGAGILVTGGVVIEPADGGVANIEQGYQQRVTAGDAILIPEGTPHQYKSVEGSVSYLEVRF